ncbi:c-type cytochrome biogenesis protein CcmI [Brucella gallinifaecis]|uniref:C-type cytochrome biogenesis protein CcmI n=1 Tax=Brucella gallinifaecis TaxID=215590 RepID=A0A502BPF2_9HYPH|nr:c-type cytochrome biogenesis protein CcmI [Brucella gallinifaecis]TPF76054.1 c-type cytochrome biogenesis protein CcmI [Brucella gallinifaecis]
MDFWLIAALLTVAAIMIVLLPLVRNKQDFLPPEKNDLEVYRDQLREVDADAARGMIDAPSAEQARIEISRRILNAEKDSSGMKAGLKKGPSARILALVSVLAVPLIAWGIYPIFGAPGVPSMPLAERLANSPQSSSLDELVARAEKHLAQNPDDARGWDVLAPIYQRMGRGRDAANAYRSSIRLEGENFSRVLGLGEALITVSGGPITAEAEDLFNKAAALQPDDIRPQYYLAQAQLQDGNSHAAVKRLQTLLDNAPADAPWRMQVEQTIARIQDNDTAPQSPVKGPTSDDVDAAASMSREDRQAMIEGMVERLDESLRENAQNLEGWKRLVRSYMILDRREAALDALKRGIAALDVEKRTELKNFASGLGLEAGSAKQ